MARYGAGRLLASLPFDHRNADKCAFFPPICAKKNCCSCSYLKKWERKGFWEDEKHSVMIRFIDVASHPSKGGGSCRFTNVWVKSISNIYMWINISRKRWWLWSHGMFFLFFSSGLHYKGISAFKGLRERFRTQTWEQFTAKPASELPTFQRKGFTITNGCKSQSERKLLSFEVQLVSRGRGVLISESCKNIIMISGRTFMTLSIFMRPFMSWQGLGPVWVEMIFLNCKVILWLHESVSLHRTHATAT